MISCLTEYALNHDLQPEPGFKSQQVKWIIALDERGKFIEVLELGDAGNPRNKGTEFRKCPDLSQPEMIAGGETRSKFLVENVDVISSITDPDEPRSSADKAFKKFVFFNNLLRGASIAVPSLELVARCLEDQAALSNIQEALKKLKAKSTDKMTFRVGSLIPLEMDTWHDWWRDFRRDLASSISRNTSKTSKRPNKKPSSDLMRCMVTGELVTPVRTHPKIERLSDVGGIASGDVLVGFDKDAFCSYGLSQAENASMGENAVAAYRAALNHLIKDNGHSLGKAKIIHWFKKRVVDEDDPFNFLMDPPEVEELLAGRSLKHLLSSIKDGLHVDFLQNQFFAIILSGAGGRVMIRDWIQGDFSQLVLNISNWFDDLSIIQRDGSGLAKRPKFISVLGATSRTLEDVQPSTATKMWNAAIRNEPIPEYAAIKALMRSKIDIINNSQINHSQMGLMKAYNLRKQRKEGGTLMNDDLKPVLNKSHPEPAYQCGRLMAVLAMLQRRALGDISAGFVQRYYAAASSTPALILGRLTRISQFHLNKLDTGLARYYETMIAEIWGRIRDTVPRTLTLEAQTIFALGYYQQIADSRSGKATESTEKEGNDNE